MKTRKKILALILSLMTIVSCFAGMGLTANAEEEPNYLKFTALAASTVTISWSNGKLQTSTDNGETWSDFLTSSMAPVTFNLATNESVTLKGKNVSFNGLKHFDITGKVAASGSVTSLIDEVGNNPNVALPNYAFNSMFSCCKGLVRAPELNFKNASDYCCVSMFEKCTSLENAPALNIETLGINSLKFMFVDCSQFNIRNAKSGDTPTWSLPAYEGFDNEPYKYMFRGTACMPDVNLTNSGGNYVVTVCPHTRKEIITGRENTCDCDGWKDCYFCNDCNTYFTIENGVIKLFADYYAWKGAEGRLRAAHDLSTGLIPATPATCMSRGTVAHYLCAYCSEYIDESGECVLDDIYTDIDPNAHDYEKSYSWTQNDGKWSCTATAVCKNNSFHTATETVEASSSVKSEATPEENGVTLYTAVFQNGIFENQEQEKADIEYVPAYVSPIREISYVPSTNSKKAYTVTVTGRPTMVQLINPSGTTSTASRGSEGVLIKSYNAAGEEVPDTARDLAYEVWQFSIGGIVTRGTVRVRAKYINPATKLAAWECDKDEPGIRTIDMDTLGLDTVVYEFNAPAQGEYGTHAIFTLETDQYCTGIRVYYPTGSTSTYNASKAELLPNGHLLYTCRVGLRSHGDNTVTVKTLNSQGKPVEYTQLTVTAK